MERVVLNPEGHPNIRGGETGDESKLGIGGGEYLGSGGSQVDGHKGRADFLKSPNPRDYPEAVVVPGEDEWLSFAQLYGALRMDYPKLRKEDMQVLLRKAVRQCPGGCRVFGQPVASHGGWYFDFEVYNAIFEALERSGGRVSNSKQR